MVPVDTPRSCWAHTSRTAQPAAAQSRARSGKRGTSASGQSSACGAASGFRRKMATRALESGLAHICTPPTGAAVMHVPSEPLSSPLAVQSNVTVGAVDGSCLAPNTPSLARWMPEKPDSSQQKASPLGQPSTWASCSFHTKARQPGLSSHALQHASRPLPQSALEFRASTTWGRSTSTPLRGAAQDVPVVPSGAARSCEQPCIFTVAADRVKKPCVTSKFSGKPARHTGLSFGFPSCHCTVLFAYDQAPCSAGPPGQLPRSSPHGPPPESVVGGAQAACAGGACTHSAAEVPGSGGACKVPFTIRHPRVAGLPSHGPRTAWWPAPTAGYTRASVPGCPAHAAETARASAFVMSGHTRSIFSVSFMSKPSMSGEEITHQRPQCERSSSCCVGPGGKFPTSLMSG
mmetsp:Transcript_78649/g.205078  ORF Transcript_78649/g.205078 Transcript_78649/m.205078 type:complete len:404 (+) Transcript_78649:190-1401(+)